MSFIPNRAALFRVHIELRTIHDNKFLTLLSKTKQDSPLFSVNFFHRNFDLSTQRKSCGLTNDFLSHPIKLKLSILEAREGNQTFDSV
ncbi:hypothetical protein VCSRO121_1797 [Vibrio cholerae]|nr:hypothetical protein VCSRO121_1797 [Vibrio cholerae]